MENLADFMKNSAKSEKPIADKGLTLADRLNNLTKGVLFIGGLFIANRLLEINRAFQAEAQQKALQEQRAKATKVWQKRIKTLKKSHKQGKK